MKRFGVTLLIAAVAGLFALAFLLNPNRPTAPTTDTNQPAHRVDKDPSSAAVDQTVDTPIPPQVKPTNQATPPAPQTDKSAPKPLGKLVAAPPAPGAYAESETIGSLDPDSGYKMQAEISPYGASVKRIELTEYFTKVRTQTPLVVQQRVSISKDDHVVEDVTPMAALSVTVRPAGAKDQSAQWINLETALWRRDGQGAYRLDLINEQGDSVLRLERQYELATGDAGYQLVCRQSIHNQSDQSLEVVFRQVGPVELEAGGGYLRDKRLYVAAYHDLDYDPQLSHLYSKGGVQERAAVFKQLDGESEKNPLRKTMLWSNDVKPDNAKLVWIASANRYFATAVYPLTAAQPAVGSDRVIPNRLEDLFSEVGVDYIGEKPGKGQTDERHAFITLGAKTQTIAPGSTTNLDIALYAGPRYKPLLETPPYQWLELSDHLIIYSLGGPCTIFTFQPLARGLLWFLRAIDGLIGDWGVAIIILVLCVRLILHPLTKRSQISMMRMGKQMQALQPEIQKLKKKYPDNAQKVQQEQMKMMREKGVNPFNMLGCLPMFLQTPIWIALFAMLSFAIELRHQWAFYGVFQKISGGKWPFLEDLSSQDNFIPLEALGWDFNLPLIFTSVHVSAINVLPILMGVVFYINQKLATPPPTNEQAAQQQKIMKYMTLLFPIFLYKAPSGLTLYMMASTLAGIVDSTIVRRHIKKEEAAGTLLQNKKPDKRGGCLGGKLAQAVEAKQQEMERVRSQSSGKPTRGFKQRRKN